MVLNSAIVFLINIPKDSTIDFALEIKEKTNLNVFLVIDDNTKYYGKEYKGLNIFQLPDEACGKYTNSVYIENSTSLKKNPIAWDKFLYLFCEKVQFDFVWVFEDDVFIPSVLTLINLHAKYQNFDLVTPNNFRKEDNLMDWHWRYIVDKIEPPYYYSMVAAMGISNKLLKKIKEYVDEKETLFFHEVMFNTIAAQNGMNVAAAFELRSVVWQGRWAIDEFLLLPKNVFHPIKNIDSYPILREQILVSLNENYVPVNNLPEFLQITNKNK